MTLVRTQIFRGLAPSTRSTESRTGRKMAFDVMQGNVQYMGWGDLLKLSVKLMPTRSAGMEGVGKVWYGRNGGVGARA